MCYYSTTMSNTRDAKEQEDLTVDRAYQGHAVLRAASDDKIVCVMDRSTIHIEDFQFSKNVPPEIAQQLKDVVGKPFSGSFKEYHGDLHGHPTYAADAVLVGNVRVHLFWLKLGTKCYVGAKKMALETKLGVDEQTLRGAALDHAEPTTEVDRVLAAREYVNSIRR